ncbi:MAG TPA: ATP-binding cassette domain-containing protein [Kiritimatiellia bacterium]|nr:ATP-binding cassette domain-containing protein [Kiritimatiellia bacterium]
MIKVKHLTRRFGRKLAVDDLSFDVARGEVLGFLGPNGAGKTTTMRIITGFLAPTGGEVEVDGLNVMTHSREIRSRIGYLPENVPLYPEMRVDEYLGFRARLKGLSGRRCRARLNQVKAQCGLENEGRRVIGYLSKGYRQRVGLADALIAEPELLILDEPTIGLDPNQIRQVRTLIRDLAEKHTIVLSTHILHEVEMTCRRVLIISGGRLVASDSPSSLRKMMLAGAPLIADIRGPQDTVAAKLSALPAVKQVQVMRAGEWTKYQLAVEPGADLRADLSELVVRSGWGLRELTTGRPTLEDVFVRLTCDAEGGLPP